MRKALRWLTAYRLSYLDLLVFAFAVGVGGWLGLGVLFLGWLAVVMIEKAVRKWP